MLIDNVVLNFLSAIAQSYIFGILSDTINIYDKTDNIIAVEFVVEEGKLKHFYSVDITRTPFIGDNVDNKIVKGAIPRTEDAENKARDSTN